MFRQPVLVYAADGPALGVVRERAVVRAVPAGDLRLAGVAVYGPRNAVDKVCKGLVLHSWLRGEPPYPRMRRRERYPVHS